MSKRILCLILSAVMVFSLLPAFAAAADEPAENLAPGEMTTDSMVTNKWLSENSNGSYDLTMSAYATGGTMTQELTSDVPLDIVLVIDQSGSMLTPDMSSSTGYEATTKNWTVDQAVGWYYRVGNKYYELKAEKGSVYNASVRPYLTDDLLGTSGGEDWHTNWETHTPNYFVKDENGNLCQLYSRSYGYVGGYDCQFYYYPQGSSSAVMIPFNSASGSTTASYSRNTFSLGTGSMNSNSNRLWTTVYRRSSTNANTRLYYLDDYGQKVYVGNEITSSSDIALENVTMYTQTTANMTRLDALKVAAGEFVQAIGDRAAETGANHRVAVVGFAGNEIPATSAYTDNGTTVDIPYSHLLGDSKYVTQNTGLFIGKSFKNYITPKLQTGSAGLGSAISTSTTLYNNITYFYKNGNAYYPLNYSESASRWYDTRPSDDNTSVFAQYYVSGNSYSSYNIVSSNSRPTRQNTVFYPAVTELGQADYQAALVSISANDVDTNNINDNIDWAVKNIDAYGGTYLSYGMAMANNVFKYNSNVVAGEEQEHKRIIVVFTDGQPGGSSFEEAIANEAKAAASTAKDTYGAAVYTVGLYPSDPGSTVTQFMHQLSSEYFTTKTNVDGSVAENNHSATYYFDDANGLTHSVTWLRNSRDGYYTYPKWENIPVGNRTIPVTDDYAGAQRQSEWVDSNGWLRGAKWNASDSRTGPTNNIWQFYAVGESIAQNKGQYYYTAQNSAQLREVFQSISESIQTPYTTVSLNGENSVLRDVITSHFNVTNTNVTFSLEKGTVASQGANPVFVPVANPTNAERAILNGLTYSWVTNADGSKTLDVKGFDYSTNFVAYQHPGYKLSATVHGISTDELGKLYSNTSASGVYKDDGMVAPLPMPYITKEADGSATYVMDFGAKMKIAEEAKFQVNVTNVPGSNGTFYKAGTGDTGTISYQLKANDTLSDGADLTMSGADTAIIHGRFYDNTRADGTKTAADSAAWKTVTVIPASTVYFDDSFNTANTVLTVGDGSGYNADVPATTTTSGIGVDGEGGNIEIRFAGSRIDVYCTTTAEGKSITANVKSVNADGSLGEIVTGADGKPCRVTMKNQSVGTDRLNVPTVSFDMGAVDTYVLTLKDYYNGDYKLDGIRVYNPVGNEATATGQYADDEQNPKFLKLRDMVVNNLQALLEQEGHAEDTVAFFTDKSDGTGVKLADYIKDGPKNEIYLDPGEAIGFELVNYKNYPAGSKVMLGLSVQGSASGQVKINGAETPEPISHTTDMYYRVYPATVGNSTNGALLIENPSGSGVRVAITNLKVSGVPADTDVSVSCDASALSVDETAEFEPRITVTQSLMAFAQDPVPAQPEQTSDPEPTPGIADLIRQLISSFVSALFGSIARLFGH